MQYLRFMFVFSSLAIGTISFEYLPRNDELTSNKSTTLLPTPSDAANIGEDVVFRKGSTDGEWESFESMHATYTQAFIDSEGFGMARILTFDSPDRRILWVNNRRMRVEKTELIGNMSAEPVAYAGSWVNPVKNSLQLYERRELSKFERTALQSLDLGVDRVWQGSDMTSQESSDTAGSGTLVAALRANASCVACHEVAEGTLLGAFAYTMREVSEGDLKLRHDGLLQEIAAKTSRD